ncbi:MAG: hypothetical protein Q9160_008237 [Pyrenula sp. 1 TL-2023]
MDDHEDINHRWASQCDYVCLRPDLVHSILQLVRSTRVVVIRATPLVGKTTLLRLLGRHILLKERDLEPVLILWERRDIRDHLPYQQFLEQQKSINQEENAKYRPQNPKAKTIYLIDEAQDSYEEEQFWSQTLKNHHTRQQSLFILVCLYGAVGVSRMREPNAESQALLVDRLQRVELRPFTLGRPCMLFKPEETADTVQKWAITNKLQVMDGVSEYLHAATDGHPGMVGLILAHFRILSSQLPKNQQQTPVWSPKLCHELIVEHNELLKWFTLTGRGLWTTAAEQHDRIPPSLYRSGTRIHLAKDVASKGLSKCHRKVQSIRSSLAKLPSYELQNLPILSEYSHTRDGRIDFFIFDKKWGIEVLHSRSKVKITEHIRRFQTGGKYRAWHILDDYIILNFCSKAALQEIEIEDVNIQQRFLQIVIDPEECTAEVYTNKKQLQETLGLGEGRQRYYDDDSDPSENSDTVQTLHDRLIQAEREKEDMAREKEDMAREKEDMARKKEDMAREKEDMMRKFEDLEQRMAEVEKQARSR